MSAKLSPQSVVQVANMGFVSFANNLPITIVKSHEPHCAEGNAKRDIWNLLKNSTNCIIRLSICGSRSDKVFSSCLRPLRIKNHDLYWACSLRCYKSHNFSCSSKVSSAQWSRNIPPALWTWHCSTRTNKHLNLRTTWWPCCVVTGYWSHCQVLSISSSNARWRLSKTSVLTSGCWWAYLRP